MIPSRAYARPWRSCLTPLQVRSVRKVCSPASAHLTGTASLTTTPSASEQVLCLRQTCRLTRSRPCKLASLSFDAWAASSFHIAWCVCLLHPLLTKYSGNTTWFNQHPLPCGTLLTLKQLLNPTTALSNASSPSQGPISRLMPLSKRFCLAGWLIAAFL